MISCNLVLHNASQSSSPPCSISSSRSSGSIMLLVATVVYGEPGAIYFNSRSPFVRCGRWRRCGRPPHLTTNDVNFVDDMVVAARASDGLPRHTQLVLAGEGRARWWRWRWVHCPPQRDSASVHHRDATDRGLHCCISRYYAAYRSVISLGVLLPQFNPRYSNSSVYCMKPRSKITKRKCNKKVSYRTNRSRVGIRG